MANENFKTYPEVDPNSRITVTSSRITWASLDRNETAYVASDKGAAYFDGNFVHLLTACMTARSGSALVYAWALTNTLNSLKVIDDASGSYLALSLYGYDGDYAIVLSECNSGTIYSDSYTITLNTIYYLKIVRDEAVGTYGTLYCYIYSDAARTTLLDTLSVALHTSKKDFQYIHAVNSHNSGDTPHLESGYTEALSIEGGEASVLPEVSQQSPTSIMATTATGNGRITSLGLSAVTQHGHCWATTANPTTANSKTTNGAGVVGAFTSAITGLTPGTKYYMRAYATNSYGTAYSDISYSWISGSGAITGAGNIAIVQTRLHYVDSDGVERYIEGTAV